MNELKMRRMKSNAGNSPLRRFRQVVFSVADDRVADRRKLHPDLILQPRRQRHPDQRSAPERAFDAISKFRASRFGVALRAQRLKHSFTSKVVNERPFLGAGHPRTTARYCLTGVWARNCRTSVSRSGSVFAKSRTPDVKRSMRCTTKGSLSFSLSFAERRDQADGVSEPLTGTAGSPAGLSRTTTASSS